MEAKSLKINLHSEISPPIWERQREVYLKVGGEECVLVDYTPVRRSIFSKSEIDVYFGWSGSDRILRRGSRGSTTVFIAPEPPEIQSYSEKFLSKFDLVLGPEFLTGKNVIQNSPFLPWHVGIDFTTSRGSINLGAEELLAVEPKNNELISIIVSNKENTKDQVRRAQVARLLKESFPENVLLYGRGLNPIRDKWEALQQSSFHVAMENSRHQDYWTEKLADGVLALNHVLYYGSPNIPFSPESTTHIDIYDEAEKIVEKMENALNRYFEISEQTRRDELVKNRDRLVLEHSLHSFFNSSSFLELIK